MSGSAPVWHGEADVIVVGTGAAGFAAALSARANGATVLMLEKAPTLGGTTARAGGGASARASTWIWIPSNSLMATHGLADPRPAALRYMARLARPHLYHADAPSLGLPAAEHALLEAFYDYGARACDELAALGALRLGSRGAGLDYFPEVPENEAPVGRGLFIRTGDDREGTGADLIAHMHAAAQAHGVALQTDRRVCRALVDAESGRVLGVEAQSAAGELFAVRARRGVIFATGGFTHNPQLRHNLLAGPTFGGAATPYAEGDFLTIAAALGAPAGNVGNAWYTPVVLDHTPYVRSGAWRLPGDSMIAVNKYGRRVVNEKATYNEMTRVCFAWDPVRAEYPNLLLFMIYDRATAERCCELPEEAPITEGGGNPIPPRGHDDAHELQGHTFEELTTRIAERLELHRHRTGGLQLAADFATQLRAAAERFSQNAARGDDPDFHRGDAAIDRARNGPPRRAGMANPTVHPFAPEGPYYAVILAPGMLDTNCGPRIDTSGRVLDALDNPIPGLYGAGNCIASPAGQAYWGGGATLGLAITFGFLAGRHAAANM